MSNKFAWKLLEDFSVTGNFLKEGTTFEGGSLKLTKQCRSKMCFSNPFITVGKQQKMARAVLLSWPDLTSFEHSNCTQVLTNWTSFPPKQPRHLSAMLGSHKEATLQFLQMWGYRGSYS